MFLHVNIFSCILFNHLLNKCGIWKKYRTELVFISNETPLSQLKTLIFSVSYTRQEHCETQMLRKRVKDLETEYKQLQLEYQVKESRVVDLESEVEVSFYTFWEWTCQFKCLVSLGGAVLGHVWSHSLLLFELLFLILMSLILCVC